MEFTLQELTTLRNALLYFDPPMKTREQEDEIIALILKLGECIIEKSKE